MKHLFLVALAISILTAGDVLAFRCGGEIITTGDSVTSLSAKCGYPTRKEFATQKIQDRLRAVERWYYNCGDRDFIYVLTIVNSSVYSEDTVGRGSGKSDCQGRK